MDTILSRLNVEERRNLFNATAERMNINAQLVEKDFWVCWILRRLFTLPDAGEHLTFKGGTSLSKAFGLIKRFSEDIDLIIERKWLGVPGVPTGSRKQWLKQIKEACRHKVRDVIVPNLATEIKKQLGDTGWDLLQTSGGNQDPRVVLLRYPTVLSSSIAGYVRPEVKMEFNARSDIEPHQDAVVRPYAAIEFPDVFPDALVALRCLAPTRTFLEKSTLLHEELCRPAKEGVRPKLSRHFYDLSQMLSKDLDKQVLADLSLYDRVVEHRSEFFANEWMGDYSAMLKGSLSLKIDSERRADWQRDYDLMAEMFFEQPPAFDEVLLSVEKFAVKLNTARGL